MPDTIVETTYGKVRGVREGNVCVWKGIPYAKAPSGWLRFRPPEPPEAWSGIRDATQYGAIPWQSEETLKLDHGSEPYRMSEDCLNLNIWSPAADNRKRPVMVWIYGGSYVSGSGNFPGYNGASFAALGDVVCVTINYRLGILGFLHLGDIAGEEYATSGNCGVLDQIASLQWIRDNIEAFGGDPNRVTIFGESAGAASVAYLMAMPQAKGLFHRAILMSGSHKHIIDIETATNRAERALRELGLSRSEWRKLLDVAPRKLSELTGKLASVQVPFGPLVDGVSMPKHPLAAYEEGSSKGIPTMMGTTLDEMRLMYVYDPDWANFQSDEEAIAWFEQRFGPIPPKILDYYTSLDMPGEPFAHKLIAMINYRGFEIPAQEIAARLLRQDVPLWMYRFDWRGNAMNGLLGACHASELPFVFNTLDSPWARTVCGDDPDEHLALQMHRAWIAFARNGDPNTDGLPHWPQYNLKDRPTLLFNSESSLTHDPAREERLLWEAGSRRRSHSGAGE